MNEWIGTIISIALFLISFGFNLWQYHNHSTVTNSTKQAIRSWAYDMEGIRDSLNDYFRLCEEKQMQEDHQLKIAEGVINTNRIVTHRIFQSIQETRKDFGFICMPIKWWQFWKKSKQNGQVA